MVNNNLYTLELFSGSGNLSSALERVGFNIITIDNRFRKGICEPKIKQDILSIKYPVLLNDIKKIYPDFDRFSFISISLPCQKWSIAANGVHFNGNEPKTEEALKSIKLLKKCISMIEFFNPDFIMFENPRGALKFNRTMINFQEKRQLLNKLVFWGSWGFETPKPTNLFTNLYDLPVGVIMDYGRGAKSDGNFNNLTVNQRQSFPPLFCSSFASYLLNKFYEFDFVNNDLKNIC